VVELTIGTYGVVIWLLMVKFKVIPINVYTIFTAIGGGVVILVVLYILLSVFHPVSHDGRMYVANAEIVSNVRGTVIEVPIKANQLLKKGDVLFRIDPQRFQIEVDRLRALLASKNSKFAQLAEQLAAAEAATKQARANLTVSESKYDRQLREAHEQAKAEVTQVKERVDLASASYARAKESKKSNVISQAEYDRTETYFQTQTAALSQAESAERNAAEQLKSGSASLEGVRQDLARLEAEERKIRTEFNTQIDGQNPEVREVSAMLDKARWDLDQTVVRAPSDGYVPQVVLRPGQMATALGIKPLMVFIPDEKRTLIASFHQKAISDIKPGMHAEAIFEAYPGRSFKVTVRRVLTAVREGELDASGNLLAPTAATAPGYIPVVFDYEDDITGLDLPAGSQASVAIYTDRVHALSIVRKIILRMKSWENYLF
jgi:multidrug resistance efflux pump